MAMIRSIDQVGQDTFLMEIEGQYHGKAGQFFMMNPAESYPLLARPISTFEITDHSIKFLFKVVGEGTAILSKRRKGDDIQVRGPYGNGFPEVEGRVALVGGGMGTAPLYETGKRLLKNPKIKTVDMFLGFSDEMILEEEWKKVSHHFTYNIGGKITDYIDVSRYDVVLACGPEVMLEALNAKCKNEGVTLYVSIEKRMACGIGACLVCSCAANNGNKKVCKDGPVFLGVDIYE